MAITDSQLLSEWDYEQNKLKPTEVSRTSVKRVWWKCRHGHSWSMKINEGEPSGQGRWLIMCPYWLDMCPCKKSLKVQEKSFQAFVCVYLNAIELKKERSFANLSHQGRGCGRFLGPELSNSKTASILHRTQTP